MSVVSQELALPSGLYPQVFEINDRWQPAIDCRLAQMREESLIVDFDDTSRFVFFSDSHRGDLGRNDAFACNEGLFLHALTHYAEKGYTYVEVGDGDELWQNPDFARVRRAHASTYELLHQLDHNHQLMLLFGNHDLRRRHIKQMVKDELPVRESLCLRHVKNGQTILVFHGHQADPLSDMYSSVSRFVIQNIWRYLLRWQLVNGFTWADDGHQKHLMNKTISHGVKTTKTRIEQRLTGWAQRQQQMVICGHTHRSKSAVYGAAPYFNTGSCVEPNQLTGIEIYNGTIAQIRWSDNGRQAQREVVKDPLFLTRLMAN